MSGDYQTALTLLAVGMLTVFIILLLVVYVGKGIILISNKINIDQNDTVVRIKEVTITPSKLAAISAAIGIVTHGRGVIQNIEKV